MRCRTKNPTEISLKDSARYEFTPQKYVENEWVTATPVTTSAYLESEDREQLQELVVTPTLDGKFAVDFYADDSIFDVTPEDEIIIQNKEFYVTFYWTYDISGVTHEKSEPFLIKVV